MFRSPLAVLVGTVALLETLLLSALAPLLPLFEDDLGLSKAEVGVLNAAYPFGTMVVALPAAYLAARVGLRTAVGLGLVLLAASTLALGLVDVYGGLVVARFVQGAAGGGIAWPLATAWLTGATPPARRGRVIGGVVGISIFGATFGPVLGAVATADRAATFVVLSVVVLGALAAARSPAVAAAAARRRRRAARRGDAQPRRAARPLVRDHPGRPVRDDEHAPAAAARPARRRRGRHRGGVRGRRPRSARR